MGTAERFDKFLANVNLTSSQIQDAQTKYRSVTGKLHSHYYGTHFDGSTAVLIGSYGKRTPVRPPRDVDVLFLMPHAEFSRYDSYLGNGQSQLLQDIKRILSDRFPTTDKIRGDGQVVVVPFTGGHTVELLPAWLLSSGKYYIPNTHHGGSWKTVDQTAEKENVSTSDSNSNGNTRNLIKMMKVWQAERNVPVRSLVLELRAVNFMASWAHRKKGMTYYDWMVRDFFAEFIDKANASCTIPGIDEKCYYGDAWVSRAQSAYGHAVKACEYEASDDHYAAVEEWQKIFGQMYEY